MTGFHIWTNRYTAAASNWGTARKIDNGDTFSTSDPQIGVDAAAMRSWCGIKRCPF